MNATLIQRSMQTVIVAAILLLVGVWSIFLPGLTHAYSVVLHTPDEIPLLPGERLPTRNVSEPESIRLPTSFVDQAFANPPASWRSLSDSDKAKRIQWLSVQAGATENSLRRFLNNRSSGLTAEDRERLSHQLINQAQTRLGDAFNLPMNCLGPIREEISMTKKARHQAWVGLWVVLGGTALLGTVQTRRWKKAHRMLGEKYGM